MQPLFDAIQSVQTEEDVKAAYAAYFGVPYNTSERHDLYTPQVLFEFKYDKDFRNLKYLAETVAQTLYYIRKLRYSRQPKFDGCVDKPIPPAICFASRDYAVVTETTLWKQFYDNPDYDWDLAPSSPDENLVQDIAHSFVTKKLHLYEIADKNGFNAFAELLKKHLGGQLTFKFAEKKVITEENFEEVFEYWNKIFGDSVRNGFKTSRYFVSDIQEGNTWFEKDKSKAHFKVGLSGEYREKKILLKDYDYFWSLYEKVTDVDTARAIYAKMDRLSETSLRRFYGEFFTPIPFAKKALHYIEKTLGRQWWKTGEYRLWDMAAGTGNLEYHLPQEALQYCYLSTYFQEDVEHLKKLFTNCCVFQYDYLNDDINNVFVARRSLATKNGDAYDLTWKLPKNLLEDLKNPEMKWIIFINPPFATAQRSKIRSGAKKDVSNTELRKFMHKDNLGEVSRELFSQFIYRIKNEFDQRTTFLGLFSKVKYITANNDQKLRDKVFQFLFERGFVFSSVNFHGTSRSNQFPVGFLLWNLSQNKKLENQNIILDVFNERVEKVEKKRLNAIHREQFLSAWIMRPKTVKIFPPFGSAINIKKDNLDRRDRAAEGFLASLMCNGNDMGSQNSTAFFSGPSASAGGVSVTAENFEQAMVVHAARRIPKAAWLNDRDQFMRPNQELPQEFITDCTLWNLFSNSNHTAALKDVKYEKKTYQIPNHFFPFKVDDVKKWDIEDADIRLTLSSAENTFVADWLSKQKLSPEARAVLNQAKKIYLFYFGHLNELRTKKFKIETYDAGWRQIIMALNDSGVFLCEKEFENLKRLHSVLKEKLLPQLKDYGIIG
ncbi:MAG: hypothetical protein LBT46_01470 [Planctomycetaceae bacterium]|jgi:hypothetical protein|nr:hypothetical protein [Planctomycetaceae bacterium]